MLVDCHLMLVERHLMLVERHFFTFKKSLVMLISIGKDVSRLGLK